MKAAIITFVATVAAIAVGVALAPKVSALINKTA